MLELRRLVLLRDLAAKRTVTAVAALHRITPSAVSQQLRVLEREAGAPLVQRRGRALVLTPAARMLVEYAERALHELEQGRAAVAALRNEVTGTLVLGCFACGIPRFAAGLVAATARQHGGLRVEIVETEPDQSLSALKAHRLDAAVIYHYPLADLAVPAGITRIPLLADPLVLVTPRSWALGETTLSGLAERPWISYPTGNWCASATTTACTDAGFSPDVHHVCDCYDSVLSLVGAGAGAALVPQATVGRGGDYAITAHPDATRHIERHVELAIRDGSSTNPVIATAARILREIAADSDPL
ncbi:LysR family transcriptional regulator [Allokutzneria sp. A3M-2-11 16]|uniref:LysR family transcriptional regulator n=1 Tax=Allokutzneria sp. A3M-2-11 16 TaxID=2962043 RepID=UPI0020B877B4|nr:LysR family transcriptional regulator [Allokutzneria sp. A3M-2-11 16]MCP3802374.1 LysR family transcriptional regulator [Allokutzneria sp. A3M-2-11 16]